MQIGYIVQQHMNLRRPPFDGPANHVRHVIQGLQARGHRVRLLARMENRIWVSDDLATFAPVVTPINDRGLLRWCERAVRRIQRELNLPYIGLFESLRFALACRATLHDCDILLERRTWMTYGGVLGARLLKRPLVLEENGDPLLDLEAHGTTLRGLQRWLSLAIMRRAMHGASHIVASGDGWRTACLRRWGLPPERVTTIENGTTLVNTLNRGHLRSFQANNSDGQRPCTLIYVGGFYPWHGLTILLHAFARARQQLHTHKPEIRLILIGAGAGMEEARQLVESLELADCITCTGHLSPAEYGPLLAGADIGLSPYCNWPEFSGLKVLDYKAAGLPTVASGGDGAPPTLRHGFTGWIVPPCDEDALTAAILHLCRDEALRRAMGRAARLEAEQLHSWHHTVARLEDIFNRLLESNQVNLHATGTRKHHNARV